MGTVEGRSLLDREAIPVQLAAARLPLLGGRMPAQYLCSSWLPAAGGRLSRVPWSQLFSCYCGIAAPLSTRPCHHCAAAGSQASPNLQRPSFPPVGYHQAVNGYFGGQIPDSAGMGSVGSVPLGAVVDITVGSTGQLLGVPAGKWGCEEWLHGLGGVLRFWGAFCWAACQLHLLPNAHLIF